MKVIVNFLMLYAFFSSLAAYANAEIYSDRELYANANMIDPTKPFLSEIKASSNVISNINFTGVVKINNIYKAFINNKLLSENDSVGNKKIMKIYRDRILIRDEGNIIEMRVMEKVIK